MVRLIQTRRSCIQQIQQAWHHHRSGLSAAKTSPGSLAPYLSQSSASTSPICEMGFSSLLANRIGTRHCLWNKPTRPEREFAASLRRLEPVTRGFSSQAEVASKESLRRARLTWESQNAGKKKSEAMLMYLVAMVTAMVGATYAAVPLYRKFCQATGYGGTVQRRETVEEKIARHQTVESAAECRELVVQFNADVADGMPWKFTPCQREIRVRPGQSTLAFYTAENTSSTPITGVSTYNVTPMKAGLYFNKIQCFCFEEQRLLPGEKIDMPIFFFIDPEFATDPKMNGINNLILSYTFFKVEEAPQQANLHREELQGAAAPA